MNKKFAAFFAEQGMTIDGNHAYGIVKGYETNALLVNMNYTAPLRLHFSFYATDEQKRNIEDDLRAATVKHCQFRFTPYGLVFDLTDMTLSRLCKRLPELYDTFLRILSENGALSAEYCPVCGKSFAANKQTCHIDGFTIHIDAECVQNINAVIEAENKDFREAPNNYLRGFAGALIGGIAGALVAILLYWVGFYSSVAAVVSVIVGTFLYKRFHGKPNKMMLVIVSATTVICMVLSVFLIYYVASGIAARDNGLTISTMEAFKIVMADADVFRSFVIDLVMVLLFSAIGIGVQIYYAARSIKRKKTI